MSIVTLKKGEGRLLKKGGCWVFDNEIDSIVGTFHNGDIVEAHGDAHTILKQQAQAKIENQKHSNGQQRCGITFFHLLTSDHNHANLLKMYHNIACLSRKAGEVCIMRSN